MWFISNPCHFDLTRDSVYPSYSIYPRECHLHSCQSVYRSWSPMPMEVVSIGVDPDKDLLHLKPPMNYQMKRIDRWTQYRWEPTTCSQRPRRRSCMGDQEVFLLPTVLISSFPHNQRILHRFLCSTFFINLRMRFLLRGRNVTPHVMATLITIIRTLTMH
jgi:hypothetical protein